MTRKSTLSAQLNAVTRRAFIPQAYVQIYQSHPLLKQFTKNADKIERRIETERAALHSTPFGRVVAAVTAIHIPYKLYTRLGAYEAITHCWNRLVKHKQPDPEHRLTVCRIAWRLRKKLDPELVLVAALGGGTTRFPPRPRRPAEDKAKKGNK